MQTAPSTIAPARWIIISISCRTHFHLILLAGAEFGEKLKTYTEKNIAAAEEFIQKLSHAEDFQDILRIQTEYMQTQFEAFGEQAKTLTEAFTKAATGATRTFSKNS